MATPKKCEIVLLRHAHSTANLKGILAGRDNTVGLSPRGEAEAQHVAQVLGQRKFDAIYVSDLKRCKQTIAPLLKTTGARSVVSKEIIEMDYGTWSGKPARDETRDSQAHEPVDGYGEQTASKRGLHRHSRRVTLAP